MVPNDALQNQYTNRAVIRNINVSSHVWVNKQMMDGTLFNTLMLHRNGPYGWPIFKQIDYNNPITRYEHRNNEISVCLPGKGTDGTDFKTFDLSPVSTRAIPGKINFDTSATQDITVVATHNNARIFFKDAEMNDIADIDYADIVTPFEQVIDITRRRSAYSPNWIVYSQRLFPSERNEFESYVTQRTGYNNQFWRGTQTLRVEAAKTLNNSWGVPYDNFRIAHEGMQLTQSFWPLDAPGDFLTRGSAPAYRGDGTPQFFNWLRSSSAGELQNTYVMGAVLQQSIGSPPVGPGGYYQGNVRSPGALYARKQTLGSCNSVVNAGSGFTANTGSFSSSFDENEQIELFAGEANVGTRQHMQGTLLKRVRKTPSGLGPSLRI